MKNVMRTNLKILHKIMQDLVQNVQLKLYVNSSRNLIMNILLPYKKDIFKITQNSKANVEHA